MSLCVLFVCVLIVSAGSFTILVSAGSSTSAGSCTRPVSIVVRTSAGSCSGGSVSCFPFWWRARDVVGRLS